MAVPFSDLQAIAPSSIIELFELTLTAALHGVSETYRFHAGANANANGQLVWNGNSYQQYPIEAEGFEYTGNGQLPRPKIRCSNILGTITTILVSLPNGLEGATVTRIRTLARYIDGANFPGGTNPYGTPDPTAEFPREIYYIDRKTIENRDVVEFELAAAFDLAGVRAPKRQVIANICQWQYRRWTGSAFDYTGVECPYIGTNYFTVDDVVASAASDDACSKRLDSCKLRFGPVNITGTVTSGSTTLSNVGTSELGRIAVGDEIKGFGLPTGTTVTAKSSNSLTLSQAATANPTATKTGTLTGDGLRINLNNVTNLAVGMSVSGTYVPSDTTISAIDQANKRVTLSITDNDQLKGSTTSKTGTYGSWLPSNYLEVANSTGVEVGDYVSGKGIYAGTRVTQIVARSGKKRIFLNKEAKLDSGDTVTASFYKLITPASATYTFTASDKYTVRPNGELPFGSFPGAGQFTL